jgi:hypothetical protein
MHDSRGKSDNGSQKEIVRNETITGFVNNEYEGWANENVVVSHLLIFKGKVGDIGNGIDLKIINQRGNKRGFPIKKEKKD